MCIHNLHLSPPLILKQYSAQTKKNHIQTEVTNHIALFQNQIFYRLIYENCFIKLKANKLSFQKMNEMLNTNLCFHSLRKNSKSHVSKFVLYFFQCKSPLICSLTSSKEISTDILSKLQHCCDSGTWPRDSILARHLSSSVT